MYVPYLTLHSFNAPKTQLFHRYQLLLTDDPSNWPWHAFINLPLIPLSLIVSRSRLLDTLPILPILLAWPSSPPVSSPHNLLVTRWNQSNPDYAFHPVISWPPSPLMATLLFPIVSGLYRKQYQRMKHWVLGTNPAAQRPPVSRVVWALNEDGPAQLRVRIGANFENEGEQRPAGAVAGAGAGPAAGVGAGAGAGQPLEDEQPDDPALVAERTMRITNASLGRFLGGALVLPAISNIMGSFLYRLSKHSRLLRQFLAVRPSLSDQIRMGLKGGFAGGAEEMGPLKQFGMAARVALNLVCGGSSVWVESDPVWYAFLSCSCFPLDPLGCSS